MLLGGSGSRVLLWCCSLSQHEGKAQKAGFLMSFSSGEAPSLFLNGKSHEFHWLSQ